MTKKNPILYETYKCLKCKAMKIREEFSSNKARPRGLQDYCRECIKLRRESLNIGRIQTLGRFKLTVEDEKRLRESQDNRCAICQIDLNLRRIAIDHDHNCCSGYFTCGKCIRGLLCSSCNSGLGMFYDNPYILIAAARYLMQKDKFLMEKAELSYEHLELVLDPFI